MRIAFPLTEAQMVTNLTTVLDRATDNDLAEGMVWYPAAIDECNRIAAVADCSPTMVAGVIAALSPRTFWSVNVAAAEHMLTTNGEHYESTMWTNHGRALDVMRGADPLATWSERTAPKIRSFYRNLCGDLSAVTVDVWASLAALTAQNDPALVIRRVGGYEAVSGAYSALAGARGLDAATLQAQIWCVIRRETYTTRMDERMGR